MSMATDGRKAVYIDRPVVYDEVSDGPVFIVLRFALFSPFFLVW